MMYCYLNVHFQGQRVKIKKKNSIFLAKYLYVFVITEQLTAIVFLTVLNT